MSENSDTGYNESAIENPNLEDQQSNESKKQEASLPRPPFPMPISGSRFRILLKERFTFLNKPWMRSRCDKFVKLFVRSLPGMYSMER